MELQLVLKVAFERIKGALAFLDKVKVDKKLRKDKEDLMVSLNVFLQQNEKHLPKIEETNQGDGELYVDTEIPMPVNGRTENYDDVTTKNNNAADELYVDTGVEETPEEQDIYEDTTEQNNAETISVTKPSPTHVTTAIPSISCDKLKEATIGEFLEIKRESMIRGSWSKRWCVVQRNIFYLYDNSSDKKQKDAFDLTNCVVTVRDNVTKEAKRKERCFDVKTAAGKTYEFCASDKDSVTKWKSCLEQASTASPMPLNQLTLPDTPTIGTSPKKSKIGNIFQRNKKTKNVKDTSDTISSVSEDDLYVDTAQQDAGQLPSDDVYEDTQQPDGEIYDDLVEDVPEVERGRKTSVADRSLPVPPSPGGDRALPPPPGSAGDRGLPPPPVSGGDRSLPVLPPFEETEHSPDAPPRSNKNARNVGLPALPSRDGERISGGGVFNSMLPPIPQDQDSSRTLPPPPGTDNMGPENLSDEDDDYKDIDIADLYQGMWDCPADEVNELSFKRGQIVYIISKEHDQYGWWIAKRKDEVGFVPKDYLMEAYEM